MARILSIHSQVIHGRVGNSIAVFAMERLGHEVLALPTTQLSNHPGLGRPKGMATAPKQLKEWLDELEKRGLLDGCDGVLTGYFPDAEQIRIVAPFLARMKEKNPQLVLLCDPVFGDSATGAYLPRDVRKALQSDLLPLADMASPNAFEAAELSGVPITDAKSAMRAAAELGPTQVVITSVPVDDREGAAEIGTLFWQKSGDWQGRPQVQKVGSWLAAAPRRDHAPFGTGDLFAALFLGNLLNQVPAAAALRRAVSSVTDLITIAQPDQSQTLPVTEHQGALLQPAFGVTLSPLGAGAEGQWVAGVDDAPGGWLVVLKDLTGFTPSRFRLCKTFEEVMSLQERPSVIAVHAPIGIPDVISRGGRLCDTAARSLVGARRSAILTPPSRAALAEDDFHAACTANLEHSLPPRKVSKQTFGIFRQIREVNDAVTRPDQSRIFESHPELAYYVMNGERPLATPKRIKNVPFPDGLAQRRSLLATCGFDIKFIASFDMPRNKAGQIDFLDACACAFTAERIAKGDALQLPLDPERDAKGLRMEIWG